MLKDEINKRRIKVKSYTINKSLILALNECLEFVLYMLACSK